MQKYKLERLQGKLENTKFSFDKYDSISPRNAVKNIKSVPSRPLSGSPSAASVSMANIVRGCWGGLTLPGYKTFITICNLFHKIYAKESLSSQLDTICT